MTDHVTPNDVANMSAGLQEADETQDERSEVKEFTPPASQEEFDRIIASRISRVERKYSDYDELKQKAQQFDDYQDSQKTAEEKLTAENTSLKEQVKALKAKELRSDIAAEYGLDQKFLGLLNGATEEELWSQAAMLAEALKTSSAQTQAGPVVSGLASQPSPAHSANDFPPRELFYT